MNPSISDPEALPAGDILIVDDIPANLRLLVAMLAEQGYKVRPALNGELALMNARAAPPDLILLDIKMPGLSGYQVCEQLKADPRTRDIPVLFISALDETLDKVKAFHTGGVDYITKPFQAEEVIARVRTHLALYDLRQRLQAQVAELDAFAHTVAHDLKTPLSLIIGYADLLAEDLAAGQDQVLQGYANIVIRTSYKMDTIIDELLLLSSIRRMEKVMLAPLDMALIVAEARARLAALITERQAEIILPDLWPVALGHGPWVEEVWVNLISNALKYGGRRDEGTPPRVELGFDGPMRQPPDDDGEQVHAYASLEQGETTVRFWVRDNGPGLTLEEQARLFTPFTRLHQAGVKGYGLGLSIVQRIVEKLGGQVGVESIVGQGSTFSFTLPSPEKRIS
jgi:two-component system sensor histidine kinase/response regulator